MSTTETTDIIKDEWLQFLEFIKRKYGSNSSEYIRINDYNNRSDRSVAAYYKNKDSTLTISGNENLSVLLQNSSFKNLLDLDNPLEISKFTEIYNDTDYLMRGLNTKDDNLYIQCNPVEVDNDGAIQETTNTNSGSTATSIMTEGADFFSLDKLYNNVGLQVFLSILLIGIIYAVGRFIFVAYPTTMMANVMSNMPSVFKKKSKSS